MSGKPSYDGVVKLRLTLSDLDKAIRTSDYLRSDIKNYTSKLELSDALIGKKRRELFELLGQMDTSSTGNAGWEGRFEFLFLEMQRQHEREVQQLKAVPVE